MDNIIKKPYEISLWEDVLTFVSDSGEEYEDYIPEDATGKIVGQYYKERKICVIGSNTMNSPIRAFSPRLNPKVNGSTELTFDLYSHYYGEDGELYNNPFIKLLSNERKIKVRYGALGAKDTKWYDLIIKNIEENSENKTFRYVAKDLFINELSKSGFSLEFDTELENNMGTISQLATSVLKGSDWKLKEEENSVLEQFKEEPLYEIILNQDIEAKDMKNPDNTIQIGTGKTILVFYSTFVNKERYFQFLYADNYEIDDDHIITNAPENSNWYIDNMDYQDDLPEIAALGYKISKEYRGKKLVRKTLTRYDATVDKYVTVFKDSNGEEVYGFIETNYTSPATTRSYITNGDMASQEAGWEKGGANDGTFPNMSFVSVPDIRDVENYKEQEFQFCLKLDDTIADGSWSLYNSGIVDHRHYIDNFTVGDQYVFRVKCGTAAVQGKYGAKTLQKANGGIEFVVAKYELVNGIFKTSDIYFQGKIPTNATTDADGFSYVITECKNSLSYSEMVEMSKTLGIFLRFPKNGTYYLGELQFFKYIEKDGEPLLPDQIAPSKIENIYYYYKPNKDYKSIEDIKFLYKGTSPNEAYEDKYNDNAYEKIRSIKAAESNRFNLIQELCEIFECWPRFEIEHDDLGRILLGKDKIWYDEKGNKISCPVEEEYRQQKWVSFREYIGKDNDRGFRYGINLKAIKRTIDSEAIVSKLIVKNNSNEFAKDGFCSIARADESPSGENFILNFDYYIQQGMLNLAQITNDLYSEINSSLGYYKKLRVINTKRDKYIIEQSGLLEDLAEYEATYKTYENSVNSANEQLANKLSLIGALIGETFDWLMANKESSWWKNKEVINLSSAIGHLQFIVNSHGKMRDSAKEKLQNAEARFGELNRILTSLELPTQEQIDKGETERLLIDKEELNSAFYKKYSRFLQEGSWISEDYIDDNLYYLDAESTLFTSAHPKITYTIDVLELSQLPGYENYTFSLGDKSFIEDTEFFGWVFKNGLQTPYKEEIVVTELILMLDEPDKNQVKVQNYKTQFEELFQRMAATTQAVEYHTGEYSKASGIIKEDGTIDIVTLQNSITNNALTIQNAKDQSVIWDDTGITTTSLTSPSEIVRIVSGGIFLSRDGGTTWNTGITGRGINANYLTSGQINTDEVLIMSGGYPSFRWDQSGISAYKFKLDDTGKPQSFNYSQYVRLDQYGLYGINGIDSFTPSNEEEVWEKSNFALTWSGFQIKSNNTKDSYISITSNNDFQLFANGKERIKIGKLNAERYGISIKDSEENVVMETNTDGTLWIKNKLYIGSENTSTVGIGYLDETRENSEIHEVIHAGTDEDQQFIVYEDGKMIASGAEFTGKIYATGGQIGNMTIGDVEATIQQSKKLDILSNLGYNFKVEKGTSSPEQLELIASPVGFEIDLNTIEWFGTSNFESWEKLSENQLSYILTYETFSQKAEKSIYYVRVKANSKDGIVYEKWATIMAISNGEDGINAKAYVLDSNQEEVLRFIRTSNQSNSEAQTDYFSPNTLDFTLYKIEDETKERQDVTNFQFFLKNMSGESVQLQPSSYLFLENGQVIFNMGSFLLIETPSENELSGQNFLKLDACIIQIKILDSNEKWLTEKSIPVRYGLNSDMATFALHAGGINAAIQNTGLYFDGQGLHIQNGGFEILDKEGNPILKAYRDGNLEIKGSGTFTGTVYASDGKFSGEIEASAGTIGGLEISENYIQSDNYAPGVSGYRLDNEKGVIYAESIEIGTNATISNQLKIGDNCYISNPNINEGNFISIKNEYNDNIFNLNDKGIIRIGDGIILDGNNSEIKDINETWHIRPSEAIFNNITAKGVIKTSVFEQGEVQAVGGMILIRPSTIIEQCWIVEGTSVYIIKPKTEIQTQQGNYCEIKQKLYIVNSIDEDGKIRLTKITQGEETSQILPINETLIEYEFLKGELLIDYGKDGDVAIAINSNDNSSGMPLQAISVIQNNFQNNMRQSSAKIVLGKMDGTYGGLTGYGLYADNVYLKGQLISEGGIDSSSYYSGIHTSSGIDMPNNGYFIQQTGKIVIWAGARSSNPEDVKNSPFKVDTYGNMYAGSGYFEGSVISKATISAAKMQTAILEGWDSNNGVQNAALTITADNAINFCGKTGENSKMQLTKDKLWLDIPLHISNFIEVKTDGSLITYSSNKKDYATLNGPSLKFSCEDNFNSKIYFSKDGLDFSVSDSTIVRMTAAQTYVSENLQCGKNINYGNIMEYRQFISENQLKGYDLYIKE